MKPAAIDKEMWDEIYNVYVKNKFELGVQKYFETQNPAALEEITAVMMETIRKGMWQATEQQITRLTVKGLAVIGFLYSILICPMTDS